MQELIIEQVEFCGVKKIDPVFICFGQKQYLQEFYSYNKLHKPRAARISDVDVC